LTVAGPAGAEVYLDEVLKGRAPLTLEELSPGPHQLRLSKEGFQGCNPYGLAMSAEATTIESESQSARDYNWETQRVWKVINPNKMNRHGSNTAYKLVPGAAIPSILDASSPVYQRAPVIDHTLWVTAYDDDERWPAGDYPTQSSDDTGMTRWIADDAPLVDTDVVLWYVFGIHHITRIEDWPVMPVDIISFWLKPFGFFDQNPTLDAPSTMSSNGHSHAEHSAS
jgi:primary-amine oxidase